MTGRALGLVIFDCDGVLIDSEPLSRLVLMDEAVSLGWNMTEAEAHGFTGLTWSAIRPIFEARLGVVLPTDWPVVLQNRVIAMMARGVLAMPGARAVLEATAALGLPYRVASNSSHQEMAEKFAGTGLIELVRGRVHSARDVAKGKPAPDVFLAAAAAEDVCPARCLVVEDSAPGMVGALAAGMRVIAYAPDGAVPALAEPLYAVVRGLEELPALFRRAMLERAA